jgi:hypothetical protein
MLLIVLPLVTIYAAVLSVTIGPALRASRMRISEGIWIVG